MNRNIDDGRQRLSCPEMGPSELAVLQDQFGELLGLEEFGLSGIAETRPAQGLSFGPGALPFRSASTEPYVVHPFHRGAPTPGSPLDVGLRHFAGSDSSTMGGTSGQAVSSPSVDDHFARALSNFHIDQKKTHHRSAPYEKDKTKMRRTSSLPELWNNQMQNLENAVAQSIRDSSENWGSSNLHASADDIYERPLRGRNLPASFFSPTAEKRVASRKSSAENLATMLGAPPNTLIQSIQQMQNLAALAEMEESLIDDSLNPEIYQLTATLSGQLSNSSLSQSPLHVPSGRPSLDMGQLPGQLSQRTPFLPPVTPPSSALNLGYDPLASLSGFGTPPTGTSGLLDSTMQQLFGMPQNQPLLPQTLAQGVAMQQSLQMPVFDDGSVPPMPSIGSLPAIHANELPPLSGAKSPQNYGADWNGPSAAEGMSLLLGADIEQMLKDMNAGSIPQTLPLLR